MIKQVLFNPTFLGIVLGLFINCVVWLLQKLYESKNLNDEKLYIRKNFLYDLIQEAEENLRQVNSKKFYGFLVDKAKIFSLNYHKLFFFSNEKDRGLLLSYISTIELYALKLRQPHRSEKEYFKTITFDKKTITKFKDVIEKTVTLLYSAKSMKSNFIFKRNSK